MNLEKMTREDLESYSYGELAELILTENKASMKIVDVFKKICSLLNMEDQFENKIADFFELISTDKNFIVLDKGFCDLRKKHTPTLIIEEDDNSDEDLLTENIDNNDMTEEDTEDDNIFYDNSSDDDDVEDDDDDEISDFMVVDDDETSM